VYLGEPTGQLRGRACSAPRRGGQLGGQAERWGGYWGGTRGARRVRLALTDRQEAWAVVRRSFFLKGNKKKRIQSFRPGGAWCCLPGFEEPWVLAGEGRGYFYIALGETPFSSRGGPGIFGSFAQGRIVFCLGSSSLGRSREGVFAPHWPSEFCRPRRLRNKLRQEGSFQLLPVAKKNMFGEEKAFPNSAGGTFAGLKARRDIVVKVVRDPRGTETTRGTRHDFCRGRRRWKTGDLCPVGYRGGSLNCHQGQ